MAEDRTQKPGTAAPAGSGDPSMEDILASIRRILNEDEPVTPAPLAAAGPEPLALTEDMLVREPAAVAPAPHSVEANPVGADPPPGSIPVGGAAAPAEAPAAGSPPVEALVAPAVAAAATAAIGDLLRTVAQERSTAVSRGGPTIEDVVRAELRPLLKEWLDRHLPGVVERLVRSEIERVVSRALS